MNTSNATLNASCVCERVRLEATPRPIACVACYCDDCQEAGRLIESQRDAPAVLLPDGGTEFLVYHRDGLQCVTGSELLRPLKLRPDSATHRMLATCCNSAMYLGFDDGKFWVDLYRSRVQGCAPPIKWRICIRFRQSNPLPTDLLNFRGYPLRLIARLLLSRFSR